MIYETLILPHIGDIADEKIDSETLINQIKEKIHNILKSAENATQKLIEDDKYQISATFDTLLFKPFIRFHDLDIELLADRTKDNPTY